MKLTYDPTAHAVYLLLSNAEISRTVEVRSDLYVDLDSEDQVVGYELLNVGSAQAERPTEFDLPTRQEVLAAAG